MRRFTLISLLLILASCGMDPLIKEKTHARQDFGLSTPEANCVCTMIYSPVCHKESGQKFENPCIAKCAGVDESKLGHCPEHGQCATTGPVCGQPPMPPCPQGLSCIQAMPPMQTYDNDCYRLEAGAELVQIGHCP